MSTAEKNKFSMRPVPSAKGMRIGIVVAEWNKDITSKLLEGACATLQKAKCKKYDTIIKWVPGTLELPMAAQILCENDCCDAVIALGSVVRGDTPHFDYVCRGAFDGLMQVQLEYDTPITFGILTTEDRQQALDRCGGKLGNKGSEAAEAAIKMLALKYEVEDSIPDDFDSEEDNLPPLLPNNDVLS